jgi:CRISPR-associated protein Cmr4
MSSKFQVKRSVFMSIDPVHIGTGGYRLGRVDAAIAREPGTKLPKVPGTSLHGAARHYAAYRYNKLRCAGQGGQDGGHCGLDTCPICYTFGFSKASNSQGYAGVVNISDARILFFPVNSMHGPVWVSTKNILSEAGITVNENWPKGAEAWTTIGGEMEVINLGWLMLNCKNNLRLEHKCLEQNNEFIIIRDHLVLVKEDLFSRIVNSNLEVRTSVSINSQTGAAEEGALFTYEAIPRATFLWTDIIVDDYRNGKLWEDQGIKWRCYIDKNGDKNKTLYYDNDPRAEAIYPAEKNDKGMEPPSEFTGSWKNAWDVVNAGLEWIEHLGIGGMGTRGFGRLRKLADWGVEA